VKSQRSLDFHSFGKCFVPPDPNKKEFGHVADTSRICPGCSGGLSIGYLRLSAGQCRGIPGNRTGYPSGRPVLSGALRTPRTGLDRGVRHRTFQLWCVCVLLRFMSQYWGINVRSRGFIRADERAGRSAETATLCETRPGLADHIKMHRREI